MHALDELERNHLIAISPLPTAVIQVEVIPAPVEVQVSDPYPWGRDAQARSHEPEHDALGHITEAPTDSTGMPWGETTCEYGSSVKCPGPYKRGTGWRSFRVTRADASVARKGL